MTEEERRRFFRIDDEVALHFAPIGEEYGGDNISQDQPILNQEFHVSLEVQIRQAMAEVRAQSPKMALVLDLLNQKINLLRSYESLGIDEPVLKMANLSACGIAFTWTESMPINQQLMLNLYLQPNHELIKTECHVAAVMDNLNPDTRQSEPYIVRLDFDNIHPSYQEVLIQHVVQRQSYQLRKKLDE